MIDQKVAVALFEKLSTLGVQIWQEQGRLNYSAPRGVVTPELLSEMKEHKIALIALLQDQQAEPLFQSCPNERYEPFPLTDVQSAYLLGRHDGFGYGGVACHLYLVLRYPDLDVYRVAEVWKTLITRHDMLRMIIDNGGKQRVLAEVPDVVVTCYSPDIDVKEIMGHRVYQTDRWPLFDLAVSQNTQGAYLHLSLDFLIADWASVRLLLSEFEQQYFTPEQALPSVTISFRDYVLAEYRLRERAEWLRDRNWWRDRLANLPSAPDLPVLMVSKATASVKFSRTEMQLNVAQWRSLKQTAARHNLTPTVVVMTVWARTLERWSQQSDFTLNLTILNRLPLHPEINKIVGDFTSVSLLAVSLTDTKSFIRQAEELSQQLFSDLDHRLYSGVEVIRDLARERGREGALMPYVFTSAIGVENNLGSASLRGEIVPDGITQTPQVFIDCQAMDDAHGLRVNWDVREGIFPPGMIPAMMECFTQQLTELATDADSWQRAQSLALPPEQIVLLDRVNRTSADIEPTLLWQPVAARVVEQPETVAIIDALGEQSYGELWQRACSVAATLLRRGCEPGEKVAVILEKGRGQVEAVLGILLCGAVYLPVATTLPATRRNTLLHAAEVRWLLCCESPEGLPASVTTININTVVPASFTPVIRSVQEAAYVIFTSGSTGTPKGVMVSHRAASNTIQDINRRFCVGCQDRVLALSQLSFDLSVYDIFGLLSVGGSLVFPELPRQTDPSHWAELLSVHQITIWNSAPALMQMLECYLTVERQPLTASLRLALLSGDWVPLTLPDALRVKRPELQVVALGGATEAAIWSNFHICRQRKPEWRSVPYGLPLSNQHFYVLDRHMRPCPIDVPGELYIGGAGLAEGYLNDKATTAERFIIHADSGERLYRTGDKGRWRAEGEMEFLGRTDNQVKVNGNRIETGEIEYTLRQHPAVTEATVFIRQRAGGSTLLAAVVLKSDLQVTGHQLRHWLSERLPGYMVPAMLLTLAALPLTTNGKVDIQALDMRCQSENQSVSSSDSALRQQLSALWCKALGVETLSPTDNFYQMGVDSLIMASMAGKLREQVAEAKSVPFDRLLRQLLNQPEIAALEEFLLHEAAHPSPIPPPEILNAEPTPTNSQTNGALWVLVGEFPSVLKETLEAVPSSTVLVLSDIIEPEDYTAQCEVLLGRSSTAIQLIGFRNVAPLLALAQVLELAGQASVSMLIIAPVTVGADLEGIFMGDVQLLIPEGEEEGDSGWRDRCLGKIESISLPACNSPEFNSSFARQLRSLSVALNERR
ncbi:amino acid adenylation domain-containing protein [Salmonella enterica subsp. enterica]|uniref:Amino acid adenylation domain-containing protein n=1 Tax=Salmonella enterica subsp. enterica serovar Java TaxID=224729 RepID=A0A3Z6QK20_SALEB|nr:amino acid adenylation domain-containing protein [Salmonella enterica subsp. enterica serovar Java]EBK4665414.1 non-ribosomal peptide synthetase [Salmonella enterica]ECA4660976.1 amino acid adenylation domain-containing protein [Salmonella enterica subsp. enterica serovar Cerro]EEP4265988.1 amino acid adenylation domain-containing protein [Salmonella enterica subsp. enterica serovar Oranienburg]HBM0024026.1 amino acid adenylation domain-containing protein [Salmonella enterica subsp. enterica